MLSGMVEPIEDVDVVVRDGLHLTELHHEMQKKADG